MSETDTNNLSETNWELIDSLTDETIDRSELPPLDESFFARATVRIPKGQTIVTMPIDAELLAWFQAQGGDSEQRMVAALRIYAEAHKDVISHPLPAAA